MRSPRPCSWTTRRRRPGAGPPSQAGRPVGMSLRNSGWRHRHSRRDHPSLQSPRSRRTNPSARWASAQKGCSERTDWHPAKASSKRADSRSSVMRRRARGSRAPTLASARSTQAIASPQSPEARALSDAVSQESASSVGLMSRDSHKSRSKTMWHRRPQEGEAVGVGVGQSRAEKRATRGRPFVRCEVLAYERSRSAVCGRELAWANIAVPDWTKMLYLE